MTCKSFLPLALLACCFSTGCSFALAQQNGAQQTGAQQSVLRKKDAGDAASQVQEKSTQEKPTQEKEPESLGPGDYSREITCEEIDRLYMVHVPKSYDKTKPTPLVIAYHGLGLPMVMMPSYCNLNETADKHGFIVVYPGGINTSWNAGGRKGPLAQVRADDVRFTSELLDQLEKMFNVDPRRVYATGMSNGAMMCYKLANDLPNRIAAIAPVSGTMTSPTITSKRPVPVIHFHGTDDPVVPFGEGRDMIGGLISFLPAPDTVAAWAKFDGCEAKPVETELPDAAKEDGTTVTKLDYGKGKDGSEVVFYRINGGGHTWPGVKPPAEKISEKFLGTTTYDIDANELIWDFFKNHPMPEKAKAPPTKGERSI